MCFACLKMSLRIMVRLWYQTKVKPLFSHNSKILSYLWYNLIGEINELQKLVLGMSIIFVMQMNWNVIYDILFVYKRNCTITIFLIFGDDVLQLWCKREECKEIYVPYIKVCIAYQIFMLCLRPWTLHSITYIIRATLKTLEIENMHPKTVKAHVAF